MIKERKIEMELIKLSNRIYMLPFVQKTDRPNLFYIKGDNYSAAIDAGNSKAHVEEFYRELEANGFELPQYTIITHWHWDHTFGLHAITGISIASALTHQKLLEVAEWEWTKEKMAEREATGEDIAFCNNCILEEYDNLDEIKVIGVDEVVEDTRELDLGGIHLKLMARDSTHSRDSLFIHIPEEKMLIIADADCEDYYDNNSQYDKDRLEDMIAFLENVDYERHMFSHIFEITKAEAMAHLKEELKKL